MCVRAKLFLCLQQRDTRTVKDIRFAPLLSDIEDKTELTSPTLSDEPGLWSNIDKLHHKQCYYILLTAWLSNLNSSLIILILNGDDMSRTVSVGNDNL